MTVFEQLQAEGYLIGRVGAGTRINERLSPDVLKKAAPQPRIRKLPAPIRGLSTSRPALPFRPYEPALTEFPVEIWARVAGRRLRRASSSLLAAGDPRGYAPLREAIAAYLGSSRGVNCSADSIVMVSGVQQGLDLDEGGLSVSQGEKLCKSIQDGIHKLRMSVTRFTANTHY